MWPVFCLCSIGDVKRGACMRNSSWAMCVHTCGSTAPFFNFASHTREHRQHLPVFNVIRSGWFYLWASLLTGVGGEAWAGGGAWGEGRSFRPKQSLVEGGLHFLKKKKKKMFLNIFGSILRFNLFNVFSLNGSALSRLIHCQPFMEVCMCGFSFSVCWAGFRHRTINLEKCLILLWLGSIWKALYCFNRTVYNDRWQTWW